jgi:hypothetical protein
MQELIAEAKAAFPVPPPGGSRRRWGARLVFTSNGRHGYSIRVIHRALRRTGHSWRRIRNHRLPPHRWLTDGRSYVLILKPDPDTQRIHCVALHDNNLLDSLDWPARRPHRWLRGAHGLDEPLRQYLLRHVNHVYRIRFPPAAAAEPLPPPPPATAEPLPVAAAEPPPPPPPPATAEPAPVPGASFATAIVIDDAPDSPQLMEDSAVYSARGAADHAVCSAEVAACSAAEPCCA